MGQICSKRGNQNLLRLQCSRRIGLIQSQVKILKLYPPQSQALHQHDNMTNFSIFQNLEFFSSAHKKSVPGRKVSFHAYCI